MKGKCVFVHVAVPNFILFFSGWWFYFLCCHCILDLGFYVGSVVNNPPANAGDTGLVPGLGRYPGEGNGNS